MAVLAVVDLITNRVENIVVAELTDKPPEGYYFVDIKDQSVTKKALWNGKKFDNPSYIKRSERSIIDTIKLENPGIPENNK